VLFVTPRYAPLTGGVETHVREVARRMPARGYDVTVLSVDLTGEEPEIENSDGVTLRRVAAFPRDRDYYWSPHIYRAVADESWDIVHCQGVHTFVPILAMAAAIRKRVPYFVTFHTGGHSSPVRRFIRPAQWLALGPMLRRARRLIAVSEFEREFFARLPGIPRRRLVVIPNGADLPLIERGDVQVDNGLIVSLGRLEKYKGHQQAIAALPALVRRMPEAHLLIVGTGPYRPELERRAEQLGIADRVSFASIDSADREGMARLLAKAGAVVLLSEYEAHAIAAIEAIALGRPVIVTDATGLHDLVEAGLTRGVNAKAKPSEIAAAIFDEIASPRVRKTRIPTWDDAAEKLDRLYREVTAR
jgi:glycosyltransferase involved in cell wall biosynthesis